MHKLGVSMGDKEEELITQSHDNKYGSHEDQDFQILHHRMKRDSFFNLEGLYQLFLNNLKKRDCF